MTFTQAIILWVLSFASLSVLMWAMIRAKKNNDKQILEWEKIKHKNQMEYFERVALSKDPKAPRLKPQEKEPGKEPVKSRVYNPSKDRDLIMSGNRNEFFD